MKMMKKMAAAASAVMIAAMSVASITASAAIEFDAGDKIVPTDKGPYGAYLCLQAGGDSQWKPGDLGGAECEFSTDGSYSVSATMANGSGTVELMLLETNLNAYSYAPDNASCKDGSLPDGCTVSIKIDSIEVKQTSGSSYTIDYSGPSDGALRLSDNGSTVRVNILNQWTKPKVADINSDLSAKGGLAAGDVVTVNFTVSGIAGGGNGGGENGTTAPTNDPTGNTTTTTATNADGTPVTTTTDKGGNPGGTSGGASGGSSNGGSSSGNSSSGKSSGNSSTGNATTSQTGDFGIAAVALGAVATAALAVGAVTVTRRKK
ncbi:hypothetical protein [uncultured Ruminococcus sp.]|uniref:hypothetical protein n=1 Tax=uncultured Ruminococcus sp. TaxID=165186 RepID=UPI0025D8AF62|nr:hypothetical protein [uncultured Ruminococcus sp.]